MGAWSLLVIKGKEEEEKEEEERWESELEAGVEEESRETERKERTVHICSGRSLVGLVVCVLMSGRRGKGRDSRG